MKELYFHSDPGHAWLAVPRKDIEAQGLLSEVSCFSYEHDGIVYLEEDCDAPLYMNTLPEDSVKFIEVFKEHSPIRHYPRFHYNSERSYA